METKSNEILDKITSVIIDNNSWIELKQPMKKLGYHSFSVDFQPESFTANYPQIIDQIAHSIFSEAVNKIYNIYPTQYKAAYGIEQLTTMLQYMCGKKLYENLFIGPNTRIELMNSSLMQSIVTNNEKQLIYNTEIVTCPIFDKASQTNGVKCLLTNGKILINFHDMQFKENKLFISFSVVLPQDHLLIDLIKQ
jgi:hypothetical protein